MLNRAAEILGSKLISHISDPGLRNRDRIVEQFPPRQERQQIAVRLAVLTILTYIVIGPARQPTVADGAEVDIVLERS